MAWSLAQVSPVPGTNTRDTTVVPAIPAPSAAGSLLVATITTAQDPDTVSGPSGWVQAVQAAQTFGGTASIWYYLNNPGGISSATFTDSDDQLQDSWMAEFTAAGAATAVLDSVGTGSTSGITAVATCTATAATPNAAGDLAVCIFQAASFGGTWTTPPGWMVLGSDSEVFAGVAFAGYQLSAPAGTLSVTGTLDNNAYWAGAAATFTPGGSSAPTGAFFSLF